MKITFMGAAREVTGSCCLVETDEVRFLVDCGMFQGSREADRKKGKNGDEHFFGRSFFDKGKQPERAFISNYQELGYLRNGILTVLLPKQLVESYSIDQKTYAATPTDVDPQLLTEAIAYYQTASRAYKSGALHAPF